MSLLEDEVDEDNGEYDDTASSLLSRGAEELYPGDGLIRQCCCVPKAGADKKMGTDGELHKVGVVKPIDACGWYQGTSNRVTRSVPYKRIPNPGGGCPYSGPCRSGNFC